MAVHEPVTGEALTAIHLAELCRDLGFFEVILESDSLSVVKATGEKEQNWLRYRHIMEDTKLVLRSLQHWKISHIKQQANEAAMDWQRKHLGLI
jgi:hypothetical protein